MTSNRARQPGKSRQPNKAGQPGTTGQPGRTRRPARPLPKGDTLFTPQASPSRQAIEQRSAAPLLWLHQLPVWLLPLLAVGLLIAGLAVNGWGGAIALAGVAAVLGWLAALSWPRLTAQGRLLRMITVGCVLIVAVLRGLHG